MKVKIKKTKGDGYNYYSLLVFVRRWKGSAHTLKSLWTFSTLTKKLYRRF